MRSNILRVAITCASVFCLGHSGAMAADQQFSLRIGAVAAPFIDGDAGSEDDPPEYSDAFEDGLGVSLEVAYRYSERLSLLGGAGYEEYSGDDYKGVSFDDLEVVPVYVGAKFHFCSVASRWDPYLRIAAGAAKVASVDVSFEGFSEQYWKGDWVGLFDFGGGVEYRFDSLSLFAEVRARYLDDPDSAFEPFSDADSSWSVPLSVGVALRF